MARCNSSLIFEYVAPFCTMEVPFKLAIKKFSAEVVTFSDVVLSSCCPSSSCCCFSLVLCVNRLTVLALTFVVLNKMTANPAMDYGSVQIVFADSRR